MKTTYKVHLMGGEGTGWALDADMATTLESLSALGNRIQFTDLEQAEVVHCVWEWPLLHMPAEALAGKRILCHICNDLPKTYEQACMTRAIRVGLWIPISRMTERQLSILKQRHAYVPYAVDNRIFSPDYQFGESLKSLRERFHIPQDRFVIGNFMRDTLGVNLRIPKDQKGVELFLEIACLLRHRGLPVHMLLAGPRRHWIRARFREHGIPFTFVGNEVEGDDNSLNILDLATINLLYHASDLHLVTSRWEGGPRAILEAAATKTPIVSTPVGLAPDVLEPESLFNAVDEGALIIENHIKHRTLDWTVENQFQRIMKNHVPSANIARFSSIYERMDEVPVYIPQPPSAIKLVRPGSNRLVRWFYRNRPGNGMRIGLWHEFHKPPYGGGNQFLMALSRSMQKLGVRVETNRFSSSIHAHLCNSAWFAVDDFINAAKSSKAPMIHRVDGPIAIYRGTDWTEDQKIYELNTRLASATVYQSGWCFSRLHELGFRPVSPVIIRNAVDSSIFHPVGHIQFSAKRKIKLISTAWSDNPKKGGPLLKWLERQLDWNRFEYTFVGRTKEQFEHIRHIPPQSSKPLSHLLRQHDIYIMASQHEACSNALIEALACGLPVLYLDDGANGELTQFGGLPFKEKEEALLQLDRLACNVDMFRRCIHVQSIEEIGRKYIELFQTVMDS
jgi:glycosyltransferase involved in cell wall biosynthesis